MQFKFRILRAKRTTIFIFNMFNVISRMISNFIPGCIVTFVSCACVSHVSTSHATVSSTTTSGAKHGLCTEWLEPLEVGQLNGSILDEESGLTASARYPRLYHINDSGDGPFFYITDRDGSNTHKVEITGFKPWDVEEVALGPCPGSGDRCVVIGDIGDNRSRRKFIEILFVEEKENFEKTVTPVSRIKLKYPDHPHNAEAFAVMPNGDIVIITKETEGLGLSLKNEAKPAEVFRLRKSEYMGVGASGKNVITLTRIGEIRVPDLVGDKGLGGRVTAMSVNSRGDRFLLMTYGKVIEFAVDLTQDFTQDPFPTLLRPGVDYTLVNVRPLVQQESISYDTNDRDFFYSTESGFNFLSAPNPPPLMKMRCKPEGG